MCWVGICLVAGIGENLAAIKTVLNSIKACVRGELQRTALFRDTEVRLRRRPYR